jgi:nucleoside-diphosphate-sugar epimerase
MAYHKLISAVLTDSSINIYGDGLQKRTNTYIDDCVDATLLAISRNATNQVFNVSGNEQITLNQAIAIIETHIGKKAKLINSEAISGDQRITQGNFQKAMDLLGYRPKSNFENGISNQIDWQKKHLKLI